MSTDKAFESQVEEAGLFTHSALSAHAERINRVEAFLYGLADALLDGGHVTEEQLRARAAGVAEELRQSGEALSGGVLMRVDADEQAAEVKVDCAARMHVCKGICCRLSFPLSAAEVEGGHVKWELGKPYFARKNEAGACVHQTEAGGCGVYDNRPRICRTYSCAHDERIWKDFDRMILNQEWIDEHLRPERPRLVAIRMDRVR